MKFGRITHFNTSFDFKKTALKLFTVGCLFGVTGCGVSHKKYDAEKAREYIIERKVSTNTSDEIENNVKDETAKNNLEQYVSLGESENPLKLLVIQNSSDISILHFGYFRREQRITDDNTTLYMAYFDDVLTDDKINLEAYQQEDKNTRYYYQLASRYFVSDAEDGKIQKQTLQRFIDAHQKEWVTDGDYRDTFAGYDVYKITMSDVADHVVAGSLYTNEVEKNRTR